MKKYEALPRIFYILDTMYKLGVDTVSIKPGLAIHKEE